MPNEIVLTPDYEHMFKTMLLQSQTQAQAKDLFDCIWETADERLELAALRAVQRFLAPLNIAAKCMTSREAVEQFRDALNWIVEDIDRTANGLEQSLDDNDE